MRRDYKVYYQDFSKTQSDPLGHTSKSGDEIKAALVTFGALVQSRFSGKSVSVSLAPSEQPTPHAVVMVDTDLDAQACHAIVKQCLIETGLVGSILDHLEPV